MRPHLAQHLGQVPLRLCPSYGSAFRFREKVSTLFTFLGPWMMTRVLDDYPGHNMCGFRLFSVAKMRVYQMIGISKPAHPPPRHFIVLLCQPYQLFPKPGAFHKRSWCQTCPGHAAERQSATTKEGEWGYVSFPYLSINPQRTRLAVLTSQFRILFHKIWNSIRPKRALPSFWGTEESRKAIKPKVQPKSGRQVVDG